MKARRLALVAALSTGCHCDDRARITTSVEAGAKARADAGPAWDGAVSVGPAQYSLPIGSALAPSGELFIASLIYPRRAVALMRIAASGARAWERDVLTGVGWSSDAELRIFPSGDGGAHLFFRGPFADAGSRFVLVRVDHKGAVVGLPEPTSTSICATRDGSFWMASDPPHASLRYRSFAEPVSRAIATFESREITRTLACGASQATVFERTDDLFTATRFTPRGAAPLGVETLATGATLVGGDEGADGADDGDDQLVPYLRNDEPGFLYAQGKRRLLAFEQHGTESVSRSTRALGSGEDVVDVEAGAGYLYVLYTRTTKKLCADDEPARSVRARRIAIAADADGDVDRILAPATCDFERSAFTSSALESGVVFGWTERRASGSKLHAPVVGFVSARAFVGGTDVASVERTPLEADGVSVAGCIPGRCVAVALSRPEGTDGSSPDSLRLFTF